MMDRQIKRDWVAALRSDRFTQARQQFTEVLVTDGGTEVRHCCLAVLTELACDAGAPHVRRKPKDRDGDHLGMFQYAVYDWDARGEKRIYHDDEWEDHEEGDLPAAVVEWAGLNRGNPYLDGVTAIDRNDGRQEPFTSPEPVKSVTPQTYAEIADAIERDKSL